MTSKRIAPVIISTVARPRWWGWLALLWLLQAGVASAQTSDFYILDNLWKVVRVDPVTFAVTTVSTNTNFSEPQAMTMDAQGRLLVVDQGVYPSVPTKLIRIDLVNGTEQLLASPIPSVGQPMSIVTGANGDIFILDNVFPGKIVRVDPLTFAVTTVSTNTNFSEPQAMTMDAQGRLLVVDQGVYPSVPTKLIRIDLVNGTEQLLASPIPSVGQPVGIAAFRPTAIAAPIITTQPQSQVAIATSNVAFTVAATGSGLTYQWRKGGADLSGETSATLTLNNVTRAASGSYSVLVTSGGSSTPSSTATLRVIVPQQLQPPQRGGGGQFQLLFGDPGGGLGSDLSRFEVHHTTNFLGVSTVWVTNSGSFTLSNGKILFDDTGSVAAPRRFYRVIEK